MSLFDLLDKARGKSESYRKRVALLSALILTSVVAFLWFFTVKEVFYPKVSNNTASVMSTPVSDFKDKIGSLFLGLKNQTSSVVDKAKIIYEEIGSSKIQYKNTEE